VTVTHPDIIRYFMTIPEAARLVVQAAAIGQSGQVLVLDMGEPVRIVDLARQLTRQSGQTVDEISVAFTGLLAGEKLFEELQRMRTTQCKPRCLVCGWLASAPRTARVCRICQR
jgi:FlaA1/EpsC-like NDP-sugar epimerase